MRTKRYYTSEGPPSLLTRKAQSDAINEKLAEYLARGGQIQRVAAGVSGDIRAKARYGYAEAQA